MNEYREYIHSEVWRQRRRAYLDKHPECNRCGMTMEEHRQRYDRSIEVHHKSYARLGGQELDEDLETLCLRCHQREEETRRDPHHAVETDGTEVADDLVVLLARERFERMAKQLVSFAEHDYRADDKPSCDLSLPHAKYWTRALKRIASRNRAVSKLDPNDERVWNIVQRLIYCETFARFCLENPHD